MFVHYIFWLCNFYNLKNNYWITITEFYWFELPKITVFFTDFYWFFYRKLLYFLPKFTAIFTYFYWKILLKNTEFFYRKLLYLYRFLPYRNLLLLNYFFYHLPSITVTEFFGKSSTDPPLDMMLFHIFMVRILRSGEENPRL